MTVEVLLTFVVVLAALGLTVRWRYWKRVNPQGPVKGWKPYSSPLKDFELENPKLDSDNPTEK